MFSHEKLDAYKAAIKYAIWSALIGKRLSGAYRHAKDQLLRAALLIVSHIAEGDGKSTKVDRLHFIELARGAALRCAAIQDVLEAGGLISAEENLEGKDMLFRIVSMMAQAEERECLIEDAARYGRQSLAESPSETVPVAIAYEIME